MIDDVEGETLDILLMCPESTDDLTEMFSEESEWRLARSSDSLRDGIVTVLGQLVQKGMVEESKDVLDAWALTPLGLTVARDRQRQAGIG